MIFSETIYAELYRLSLFWAMRAMQEFGYVQVSRRFRIVARIDTPTPPAGGEDRDYYRRVISKDTIEDVPEFLMEYLRDE